MINPRTVAGALRGDETCLARIEIDTPEHLGPVLRTAERLRAMPAEVAKRWASTPIEHREALIRCELERALRELPGGKNYDA